MKETRLKMNRHKTLKIENSHSILHKIHTKMTRTKKKSSQQN